MKDHLFGTEISLGAGVLARVASEDMATEFSAEQAQERLPDLLDRVESGEEIVITRFGAPSVTLQSASDGRAGAAGTSGVPVGMWPAPVAGGGGGDSADTFDVGTDYLTDLPG